TGVGTTVNSGATPRYTITMSPNGDAVGDPLTALASTATASSTIIVNSSSLMTVGSYVAVFSGSAWQVAKVNSISGQLVLLDILVFPSAAGTYTNIAAISDGTALNTRNASTTATTTFGALNPSKVTTTPTVTAGGVTPAHYSITVQNPLASTAATGVQVTD